MLSLSVGWATNSRSISSWFNRLEGRLDTLRVTADAPVAAARGVGTAISDSTLRRLPTLNGDMYDFVRMVPQVGTRFGLSGGGRQLSAQQYLIDGVSDRNLQGNGGGTGAGNSIPLDAVKEYQVLLSPFDPRYGDFTGLLRERRDEERHERAARIGVRLHPQRAARAERLVSGNLGIRARAVRLLARRADRPRPHALFRRFRDSARRRTGSWPVRRPGQRCADAGPVSPEAS